MSKESEDNYLKLSNDIYCLMLKYSRQISDDIGKRLLKVQINILLESAKIGNREAQYELALKFADSGYFRNNPFYNENKYVYWLKKAIKNGHIEAKLNLASVYNTSENNRYSNVLKGLELYKEAYLEDKEVGELNYNICKRNLKNKNSTLRKSVEQYFKRFPKKKEKFLNKNPDYKHALYPVRKRQPMR